MDATRDERGRPSGSYHGGQAEPHDELAGLLASIARDLDAEPDVDTTIKSMVTAVVALVPGAESAGVTEVRQHRDLDVRFASDDFVVQLDRLQEQLQEGPCLAAAYEHRTVRIDNLRADDRWPRFAARAVELGAASMLSVQLFVHDQNMAALNLYARSPSAFTDESEEIALLFATHAAIAMASARRDQQLRVAVDSRDVIGQAKGILMERFRLDAEQAFQVLIRASSTSNTKLREVADYLAATGEMPT